MYLIFFSGPPCCGKSTLAHAIARKYKNPLLSRDQIQGFLSRRGLITTNTVDGYLWVLEQGRMQLSLEVSCILDAVFPRQEFREVAEQYAQELGATFIPIYCYCSDKELWHSRWLARATNDPVSHWMEFAWADVERIEKQFEPWKHECLIELDAVQPYEINLHMLVENLQIRMSS
jgi:predicted kinase